MTQAQDQHIQDRHTAGLAGAEYTGEHSNQNQNGSHHDGKGTQEQDPQRPLVLLRDGRLGRVDQLSLVHQ